MTTQELMIKAKDILEANGYEVKSTDGFTWNAKAVKDGKAWETPVEGYTFTRLQGHTLGLGVVHRSNGTENNISVDVTITKWHESCGTYVAKERINVNMSDKSINNRINKIMAIYEAI